MLVNVLPQQCDTEITQHPQGRAVRPGVGGTFSTEGETVFGALSYEWQLEGPFCSGDPCTVSFPANPDEPIYDPSGPVANGASQGTPQIVVTVHPTYLTPEFGRPRTLGLLACIVRDACGQTLYTDWATITVCPADFNNDGTVNSTDVSDFINAWFEDTAAGCG